MDDTLPEWLSELPTDLHDAKVLHTVPDIETLAKNYVEQDKTVNGSIRLPKENDDASQTKFTERLEGMGFAPKEVLPDEYEMPDAGEADWEKNWSENRASYYKEVGLTKAQATKAMEVDFGQLDGYRNKMSETTKALKEEHGEKLDSLLVNAKKAVTKYGLDELSKSPFGASKEWNSLMINLGKEFNEDGAVERGNPLTGESLDAVNLELDKKMAEMVKLSKEGKLTEGSPEARVFTAELNEIRGRKYNMTGKELKDGFVNTLHSS